MTLRLNQQHLIQLSTAAAAVVGGVVAKNSAKQLNKPQGILGLTGIALFTMGWVAVGYLIGKKQEDGLKLITYLSAFGIWYSASKMRTRMDRQQPTGFILPLMFVLSWLTIGYISGLPSHHELGLIAAGMVLLSMLVFLPRQRKECVVDGPGMPFFVVAWAIISVINSIIPTNGKVSPSLLNQLRAISPFKM